jgi:hypothetical protein
MLFSYWLISNRILAVAMDATERIERRLKLHVAKPMAMPGRRQLQKA